MSDPKKFIQENPLDVIELFGGIRPMATKLGIAATTIQGWKKRESIPDARIEDIIQAATQNRIRLIPSNENLQEEERPNIEDTIAQIKAKIEQPRQNQEQPDEEILDFSGDEEDADDSSSYSPIEQPPTFISEKEEPAIEPPSEKPETLTPASKEPKEAANSNTSTSCPARKSASGTSGWLGVFAASSRIRCV